MSRLRSSIKGFNKVLSKNSQRLLLFAAAALLCLGLFVHVTWELHEDSHLDSLDQRILVFIASLRVATLNGPAVDLTALGSPTVVTSFTLIGIVLLWLARDRRSSIYIAIGSAGAGIGTYILKHLFTRERPSVVPRLVEVSGFSYPSGHSFAAATFYLLFMFLAWQRYSTWKSRAVVSICTAIIIGGVCLSRLYLGAHYPSDVLSGACLGAAWVFSLTAYFSRGHTELLGQKR